MFGQAGGAQDVGGTVRDAATSEPVRGAVVVLLGPNRELLARAITSSSGTFRIRDSSATMIRVMRIGYSPHEGRLETATRGNVSITLTPLGRSLRPVAVNTRPACPARQDQRQALAVWSSATDAMLAMVVAATESSQTGTVTQLLYNRLLSDDGRRVMRQSSQRVVTDNVSPIRADRDPDEFVASGYVVARGNVTTYYGPDPEVLLDSSFAATHCLSIRTDARARPGEVGVGFAPARGRDSIPDIAGVLWLTRSPMALRSLSFEYRNVDQALIDMRAGGLLEFETNSNGVPFIRAWHVRSPKLRYLRSGRYANGRIVATDVIPDVLEIHETGGLIAGGRLADGTPLASPLATLGGVVQTVRTNKAVSGAVVTLDSTDQRATTDSAGRFTFEQLLPGPHMVRVQDSVTIHGLRPDSGGNVVPDSTVSQHLTRVATRAMEIRAGPNGPLELVLPWREPVDGCGRQGVERRFVVTGVVQRPDSVRVPDAYVRFSWADTSRGTTAETMVDTKADAHGVFVMCGIPAERAITTRVLLPRTGHGHFGVTRISRLVQDGNTGLMVPGSLRSVILTLSPD